jgi:transposase
VKLLVYDGQGFWLCQKRLSEGRFRWWPSEGRSGVSVLEVQQLQMLLWNGDPLAAKTAPAWRKLETGSKR